MAEGKIIAAYMHSIGLGAGIGPRRAFTCERCLDTKEIDVVVGEYLDASEPDGVWRAWAKRPCPDCCCPVCGDRGVVTLPLPLDDPQFGKLQPCPERCGAAQALAATQQASIRRYSQLPEESERHTLASFMALSDDAREGKMRGYWAARLYLDSIGGGERPFHVNRAALAKKFGKKGEAEDWRNWLVFYGPNGTCKTGMAASIINGLADAQVQAMYIRLQDFIQAIQNRYKQERQAAELGDEFGDDTAAEVIERVRAMPVLVIDEFDEPNIKPDKESIVWKLINYRYIHQLPTVITCNLDEDAMESRWGTMVTSRMIQRAHWIPMTGDSLRVSSGSLVGWE
jgi:hypothetical protein